VKLNLVLIILFVLSCQTNPFVASEVYREIANSKNLSYAKKTISKKIYFTDKPKILFFPQAVGIHSISFKSGTFSCSGQNIVKYPVKNKIKYFVSDKSHLQCRSLIEGEYKIDYEFNILDEKELANLDHLNIVKNRLEASEFDLFLKESHLSLSLSRRMTLSEFKKINFLKGDYISVNFLKQSVQHECLEKDCSENISITGVPKSYDKEKNLNLKQVKYPQIAPFVAFCGSRFSASNIQLNTEKDLSYSGYISDNGFSCEINTYLFSKKDPQIIMDVIHISNKQMKQSNLSIVETYFKTLELMNLALYKSEISFRGDTIQGYLELHFKRDRNDYNLVDIQKVTPSLTVTMGQAKKLHFAMRAPSSSVTEDFTVRLCPEDLREILKNSNREITRIKNKSNCILKKE
jgi:hypothetical protein